MTSSTIANFDSRSIENAETAHARPRRTRETFPVRFTTILRHMEDESFATLAA